MGYLTSPLTAARAHSSTFTSTLGITLPTAAINTKGSYIDVLNPVPFPTGFLLVSLLPQTISFQQGLVDIAYTVGGGSEHIVARNIGVNSVGDHVHVVQLPVRVPRGAVIRARFQRSHASLTMRCAVQAFAATDLQGCSAVQTLGAVTATSRGTSVDPGAVANTKGAYSQLSAATTQPITRMILHIGGQANAARTYANYLVDIAVGPGGSERVVIPNCSFTIGATADEPIPNYIGPFPISIPVGSRVAARGQSTITDATDRLFDVIAYGIA